MLHRQLPNRFLIAIAALLSVVLASPWAAAAGADVAQVTVVSPGGAEQTLSLDALAGSEDVLNRAYALRSEGGESTQAVTGFSLARVLDAAGADPYSFSFLEVQRPAGGAVLLSRERALSSNNGDGPPVIYPRSGGAGFLRPSTGAEDLNGADSFAAPQGIAIVLRKGTHLRVRATASTQRTRPGQKVDFSAVVEQAGAGEQLTCSWYFDDGKSATGPEASHSFSKRGSYDVVVGVTSDGDDVGTSEVVTIQVGAPLGGPDRKGGGRNDDTDAPSHGAAEGGEGERSIGGGPVDTQPAAALSVPRTPTDRPQANKAEPKPAEDERIEGDLVEGELVSAEGPLSPPQTAKQAAARSGRPDDDGDSGGIPGAAWGILATVALLGAGALIETRGLGAFVTHQVTKAPRGGRA